MRGLRGGESGIVVNVVTTHLVAGVDEVVVGGDGGGHQLVRGAASHQELKYVQRMVKRAAHHTRLRRRTHTQVR